MPPKGMQKGYQRGRVGYTCYKGKGCREKILQRLAFSFSTNLLRIGNTGKENLLISKRL